MYIRPLLFGSGPRIGLQPSDEYTLLVMAIPVGDYYKGGMKPTTAVVIQDYDRAAPKGVGHVKVGARGLCGRWRQWEVDSRAVPADMHARRKAARVLPVHSGGGCAALRLFEDGGHVENELQG